MALEVELRGVAVSCSRAQHAASDATSESQQQAHELQRLSTQVQQTARELATQRDAVAQAESCLSSTQAKLSSCHKELREAESAVAALQKSRAELDAAVRDLDARKDAHAAEHKSFAAVAVQTASVQALTTDAQTQAGAGDDGTSSVDAEAQCSLLVQPLQSGQNCGEAGGSQMQVSSAMPSTAYSQELEVEVASMQDAIAVAKCATLRMHFAV